MARNYSAGEGRLGKTTAFNDFIDKAERRVASLEAEVATARRMVASGQYNTLSYKIQEEQKLKELESAENAMETLRAEAVKMKPNAGLGDIRDAIENKTAIGEVAGSLLNDMSKNIGTIVMFSEDFAGVYEPSIVVPVLNILENIEARSRAISKWVGPKEAIQNPTDPRFRATTAYKDAIFQFGLDISRNGLSRIGGLEEKLNSVASQGKTPEAQKAIREFGKSVAYALGSNTAFNNRPDTDKMKVEDFNGVISDAGKSVYRGTYIGADERNVGNRVEKDAVGLAQLGEQFREVAQLVSKAYENELVSRWDKLVLKG